MRRGGVTPRPENLVRKVSHFEKSVTIGGPAGTARGRKHRASEKQSSSHAHVGATGQYELPRGTTAAVDDLEGR